MHSTIRSLFFLIGVLPWLGIHPSSEVFAGEAPPLSQERRELTIEFKGELPSPNSAFYYYLGNAAEQPKDILGLPISAFSHPFPINKPGRFWTRFKIINRTDEATVYWKKRLGDFSNRVFTVYDEKGNWIETPSVNTTEDRTGVFALHLKPELTYIVVISIETTFLEAGVDPMTPSHWKRLNLFENFGYGFYLGLTLMLILVSLGYYFGLRENSSLFYIIYLISNSIMLLYGAQFSSFFTGLPTYGDHYLLIASISIACSLIFGAVFLKISTISPKLYFLNGVIICSWLGTGILSEVLFGTQNFVVVQLYFLITLVVGVAFVFYCAVTSIRAKVPGALGYLIGQISYAIMAVMTVLWSVKLFPGRWLPPHPLELGTILENIILTAALANKINSVRVQDSDLKARAESADRLQNFLKVVAHDFANPLSVISMVVALENRKGDRQWSKVQRATAQLTTYLDYIRTNAAAELGKLEITLESVNLSRIAENIDFLFGTKIRQKNIILKSNFSEKASTLNVQANFTLLSHTVINNLISNAIKFSPEGGTIELTASDNDRQVMIKIRDYGCGIPPELIQKIFKMNSKVSRKGTQGEAGTGFGLPLAYQMIQSFEGDILIESPVVSTPENTAGSQFIVILPKATETTRSDAA